MKNYLFVLVLSITQVSFTQETETYYQTIDKEYAFKFTGEVCTLYQLSEYNNYAYREWELERVDRFKGQLDSLGILFSNGEYAISYDYKYFRVLKLKRGKQKDRLTFVAKKLDNPSKVYEAINHSYWNVIYRKTMDDITSEYPLFHSYYYGYGNDAWEPVRYKQVHPAEFELLAKDQTDQLKDSVSTVNKQLISLNEEIEKNIREITLEKLKSNFLERPIHQYAYYEYQNTMLNQIAENRPDLFYALAQEIPEERNYLFSQIDQREAVKSLKGYDTDSSIKKEFRRFKRKQAWRVGLISTGIVTLQTAVIGGAITGIVFWVRK